MYMISEITKTSKLVPITPPIMPPAMVAALLSLELKVVPRERGKEVYMLSVLSSASEIYAQHVSCIMQCNTVNVATRLAHPQC